MDSGLRRAIEQFVQRNIVVFHDARIDKLQQLKFQELVGRKNPYLFRAKNILSAADFISTLLAARVSSSEEGMFGAFLEELAVFVASATCGGKKAANEGVDIDLTKNGVRYLIAVKSGQNWGNSAQHKRLKDNFKTALKVIKQSRQAGEVEPVLGICYGKFKESFNGLYRHVGGQRFWYLLSDDPDLYADIIEPVGYEAKAHDDRFQLEYSKALNRLTAEFMAKFCDTSGSIRWADLVKYVSENMEPPTKVPAKRKSNVRKAV